jgi:heme/copper-type cytochrome/quinol oxidase subunit 2
MRVSTAGFKRPLYFPIVLFLAAQLFSVCMWAQSTTVAMTADKDNRFRLADGGSVLYLKAGEKVHFKVTSTFAGEQARDGSVHSLVIKKLRDQGWDIRLKPGAQEFDLVAPPPGEYLIECTVKCGPGHDDMNLKVVVK